MRRLLFLSLCFGLALTDAAQTQNRPPREPHSTITVLVDLSETWFNEASNANNRRVLKAIADALTATVRKIKPPIAIRYLAIGDKSLGRTPLCEAVYSPNILGVPGVEGELVSPEQLLDFTTKACPTAIFLRGPEKYTDISGALDTVSRISAYDMDGYHGLIIISDFQEDRRKKQSGGFGSLRGMHTVLLYRVLDADRLDSRALDTRIRNWEIALKRSGATVVSIDDVAINPGLLNRLLLQ